MPSRDDGAAANGDSRARCDRGGPGFFARRPDSNRRNVARRGASNGAGRPDQVAVGRRLGGLPELAGARSPVRGPGPRVCGSSDSRCAGPYTFVVLALLIAVLGILSVKTMLVDIFPSINIPVVTVIWSFSGLSPTEMQGRIVTVSERAFTTTVNGIEHVESVSLRGVAHHPTLLPSHCADLVGDRPGERPGAADRAANCRRASFPPLIIQYNAASVPVLLASLSSDQLSEQQLQDLGNNFIRTQLVTIPGAAIPAPYGGKVRIVNVDIDPDALYSRGLAPQDVSNAILTQKRHPAGRHA